MSSLEGLSEVQLLDAVEAAAFNYRLTGARRWLAYLEDDLWDELHRRAWHPARQAIDAAELNSIQQAYKRACQRGAERAAAERARINRNNQREKQQ